MSRFGSDPLAFFGAVYAETAPWDIGEVRPAMAALLENLVLLARPLGYAMMHRTIEACMAPLSGAGPTW